MSARLCARCETPLPHDATACPDCGLEVESQEPAGRRYRRRDGLPPLREREPTVIVVQRQMPTWAIVVITLFVVFVVFPAIAIVISVCNATS